MGEHVHALSDLEAKCHELAEGLGIDLRYHDQAEQSACSRYAAGKNNELCVAYCLAVDNSEHVTVRHSDEDDAKPYVTLAIGANSPQFRFSVHVPFEAHAAFVRRHGNPQGREGIAFLLGSKISREHGCVLGGESRYTIPVQLAELKDITPELVRAYVQR